MNRMTYEDIKRAYPNQWVLIDEMELDRDLEVKSGVVVAHSPKRSDVDAASIARQGSHLAIRYTGKSKGVFVL